MTLLAKSKFNSTEVLISKVLLDSYIIHDEFVLVNDVSRECDDMKEEIKMYKFRHLIKYLNLLIKQCYCIVWSIEKKQILKTQKSQRKIKESE